MGGLTQRMRALEAYDGTSTVPRDLAGFWRSRLGTAAPLSPDDVRREPAGFDTPVATYEWLTFAAADGTELKARYVCPRGVGGADRGGAGAPRVPTVVMTHDVTCGPRGWHHLTRFAAIGHAVVELERRPWSGDVCAGWEQGPAALQMTRLIEDMARTAQAAASLPRTDVARLSAWGEGLAGALAIDATAALDACDGTVRLRRVAALNPMPADVRATWEAGGSRLVYAAVRNHFRVEDPTAAREAAFFSALDYVDAANMATLLRAPLLLGTSMMDDAALPQSQYAVFNRVTGEKRHLTYPKWGHERVNDFEDALMAYLVAPWDACSGGDRGGGEPGGGGGEARGGEACGGVAGGIG